VGLGIVALAPFISYSLTRWCNLLCFEVRVPQNALPNHIYHHERAWIRVRRFYAAWLQQMLAARGHSNDTVQRRVMVPDPERTVH
jgi:hypothetical protein